MGSYLGGDEYGSGEMSDDAKERAADRLGIPRDVYISGDPRVQQYQFYKLTGGNKSYDDWVKDINNGGTTPPPGTGNGGTSPIQPNIFLPPGVDPYYGLSIAGLPGGTNFNVATPNMTWQNSLPTVMPANGQAMANAYGPSPYSNQANTPQVPTTPRPLTYNNPYNTNPYLPLSNPFALVPNNTQ